MSEPKKTVGIVGAGSSALVSAKYAVDYGLLPTLFEKTQHVGGLWNPNNKDNAVWDGLRTNVSYHFMCYSGIDFPENSPIFAGKQEMHDYFASYMKRFNLEQYIKFNSYVCEAKQLEDKRWRITYRNNGEEKSQEFDFLIVASGLHEKKRIPPIKDQDKFKGLVLHSSEFRLNKPEVKDKKVVVLGHSYSGADVSQNCVGLAKSVVNVFRRPYLVVRRIVRFKSDKNRNKKNIFHIAPIDFVEFKRSCSMQYKSKEEQLEMRRGFDYLNHEQTNKARCKNPDLFYDLEIDQEPRMTIADNYWAYAQTGRLTPKKGTFERFVENGVYLNDGTFLECDVVIYATGFDLAINYLDKKSQEAIEFEEHNYKMPYLQYKLTFNPNLENAAFICQNEGVFYTAAELQAMWVAKVFSGVKKLPPKEEMLEEIDQLRKRRQLKPDEQYVFGEHVQIIDMIARAAGEMPDMEAIKKNEPKLYNQLYDTVSISCHFKIGTELEAQARAKLQEMEDLTFYDYECSDDDETDDKSISYLARKLDTYPKHTVDMDIFKT